MKNSTSDTNGLPRLKDIAERANVSIAATSIILSKETNRFSQKTCDRVRRIAEELGWQKNLLADGIQSGKTKTVGVLIGPADSYYNDILRGIHTELARHDYVPITLWADMYEDDPLGTKNGLKQIQRLIGRRVEGFILRPTVALAYETHIEKIISHNIPTVIIDHELKSTKLADTIETDEELGARLLADHLHSLGHRKFLYVNEENYSKLSFALRRVTFFKFALNMYYDITPSEIALAPDSKIALAQLSQTLQNEDRPTAICCVTDGCARRVAEMLKQLGLSVPREVSLTGYADCDYASLMQPALTTIRQRPFEIGRHAAKLIIDRASNKLDGVYGHVIKVGCELVARESTAPPKAD